MSTSSYSSSRKRLNRGPLVVVNLFFDGCALPDPGPAAWAAVAIFKIHKHTNTIQWSAPIGMTAAPVAKYLGLINGIRRVIAHLQCQSIRHSYVRLRIHGDSTIVIQQLTTPHYIPSDLLDPVYNVATNILTRFQDVDFDLCSPEQNATAHRLAIKQLQNDCTPPTKSIYYPSLINFVDAWVEGVHAVASHDLGTRGSDPTCFIDATFLYNLPNGKLLYRNIQDPYPLSIVLAKVDMTVLGTIPLDISVSFSRPRNARPHSTPPPSNIIDMVVVHTLPVPIHISHRNPHIGHPDNYVTSRQVNFAPENLPHQFAIHSYWHSDSLFLGIEDTDVLHSSNILSLRQLQQSCDLNEDAIASLPQR